MIDQIRDRNARNGLVLSGDYTFVNISPDTLLFVVLDVKTAFLLQK